MLTPEDASALRKSPLFQDGTARCKAGRLSDQIVYASLALLLSFSKPSAVAQSSTRQRISPRPYIFGPPPSVANMSNANDLEKNAGLPSLADVYGGIEDSGAIGGVSDQSEPIAAPSASSSDPKNPGGSGSWFTKKRIIIIAVVAIIVIAGAVGGAVGGVLSKKNDTASPDASSGQTPGPASGGNSPSSSGSGSNGASPASAGGSTGTVSTVTPNPTATGIIIPSGVTAVAFSGVPTPSVSSQPLAIGSGFPGLEPALQLNAANLVTNADFKQNLSNWENPDGCWDVNRWDERGYVSAWNGEHPGGRACDLAQTMGRGDAIGKDTEYVVSFLYRNSVKESSNNAWFWAYIGDENTVSEVLATNERSPTSEDRWSKAAYKYTVRANKKARIVFKGYNDAGYWEVSEVQMVPLSAVQ
ncbi:hypothetical protein Dda_0019 [Drechslerella dactyloides]|uniref:Uncharacterized protein n=1 Tax=Drechslerella dactyloides TaxID=74499 RepID=A0AAD6J4Y9_DREDA|nr:hypothetical protein Dda_0019 [Drechslerella dactyloides]